ncbi:MAG TPA: hypothetical protein VN962_20180 [Polyangia bacterium]|nr:hypothetical protein [Polyangia bacterium]
MRRLPLAFFVLLLPRPGWALCASCLGQSSRLGPALKLVGAFLLIPPAIFFAVSIAIRKLTREPDQGAAASAPGGGGGDQGG